MAGFRADKG